MFEQWATILYADPFTRKSSSGAAPNVTPLACFCQANSCISVLIVLP